jgi:hypothetical protein
MKPGRPEVGSTAAAARSSGGVDPLGLVDDGAAGVIHDGLD